jgi:uncharacterized NAD(P)/FAD-binding protein YdhS
VYSSDPAAAGGPVIAVIGAGASGTLAVVHLLREAAGQRVPLRIALIDQYGRHGRGQAYSTTHPGHLLTSPASDMSAMAGDPGHFTRWLQAAGLARDGLLPRSAYGSYLAGLLADAQRQALPVAHVSHLTSQVVAIRRDRHGRPLRLHLAADGRIDADIAVLATGQLPAAPPCPVPRGHRYIADPWAPAALDRAADGSPVVILGSGLTMLEAAIAVTDASPGTVVHAVSPHALPEPAKRLSLRHLARYLELHRHRLPPATESRAAALRSAGRLLVLRGRVAGATGEPGGIRVRIDHGGSATELTGGWLINCTGPAADISATADPLLRCLLDSGTARPAPLGLALDTGSAGALRDRAGRPASNIFAVGPPPRARRPEVAAIPEIREQAALLARSLVATLARAQALAPAQARPGSAA